MRLSTLVERVSPRRVKGSPDACITGLYYDSRKVQPGGAFFALRGTAADGHLFIDDALRRGAGAVFMEEERELPEEVVAVTVTDAREAMAQAAAAFYGYPTAAMRVAGVTGTNGKTTVTYLLEAILLSAGLAPAVLGTVAYRFGDHRLTSTHTTPESVELMEMLASFRDEGADSLLMEVSSHAIDQHRVAGIDFGVRIFTNLTPEHLDYHGDMEGYFASKKAFFEGDGQLPGRAVVNLDDPYGARLAAGLEAPLTFALETEAEVRFSSLSLSLSGIEGRIEFPGGAIELRSTLLGRFNASNLLCAAAAALAMGIEPAAIVGGLSAARQVPGRLERIENSLGVEVLVDYAHTGDALEKALQAVVALEPRRIITVFGCGGDRDRTKRPVMGEIAARYSDLSILTSDNPRTEDPRSILEEVKVGALHVCEEEWSPAEAASKAGKGFVSIVDRKEAIELAVAAAGPGDLILVAGKGHEDYQVIGSEHIHFDDREELRLALAGREGTR